jgi:putative FmdB family regulatory protein
MPLYEYECDACHHRFEVIQKFSDPPIETCPKCGSAVHKLPSSPAIQFKGSGWYITDYARAGKSGDGKSSTSGEESKTSESKSESSGDAKTDTKSDSKTDNKTKSETKSESKPLPSSTS